MYKIIFSCLITLVSSVSIACPDLNGEYIYTEEPWNGKILVTQQGCESVIIKFIRGEDQDVSSTHSRSFIIDGRAYRGVYQSEELASATDRFFNIASFVDYGLSMVNYSGSQEKCSLNHTFNALPGNCKKTENRLEFNQELNQFTWRQIGYRVWDDGWSDDIFVLEKIH